MLALFCVAVLNFAQIAQSFFSLLVTFSDCPSFASFLAFQQSRATQNLYLCPCDKLSRAIQ